MINQWELMEIFEKEKAIEKGHFLLSSGLHSDLYVQCARVLQHPHLAERLAGELAEGFETDTIDLVLSPALGGIIIGYMVALVFKKRMIFAERVGEELELRRGQVLHEGERALIVEDVITTGGSVGELRELLSKANATLAGVGALIERGGDRDFDSTKRVLIRLDASVWEESDCPLCRKGVSMVIPGSRRTA
jgi:orotate phosphoribosyltransferase